MEPEPRWVRIDKAGTLRSDEIQSVTIAIHEEIPSELFQGDLEDMRRYYREQAELLSEALLRALPGGTVDALLAELMRRKAGLLRVPLCEEPDDVRITT